jgi:hypothetical protein
VTGNVYYTEFYRTGTPAGIHSGRVFTRSVWLLVRLPDGRISTNSCIKTGSAARDFLTNRAQKTLRQAPSVPMHTEVLERYNRILDRAAADAVDDLAALAQTPGRSRCGTENSPACLK